MNPIKLNENYRIEKDTYSWVLIFNEEREKETKKTGKKEPFIYEDKWFYPDLKQLLKRYIDLDLKQSNTIEELSNKLESINTKINELKNTIFKL